MLAITLFIIFYSVLCVFFHRPQTNKPAAAFPEQVFQIIDDEPRNNDECTIYDPWFDESLGLSRESLIKSCRGFVLYEPWMDEFKKQKISELTITHQLCLPKPKNINIDVDSKSFSALKKIASTLKKSGFLNIKITGKGVTKNFLKQAIQQVLDRHPDAYNVI